MTSVSSYRPGGRTRAFGDEPFYDDFVKLFRQEEQTALWNRGLGLEDIVRGLAKATGLNENAIVLWFERPRSDRIIGKAAGLWAATLWHRSFPGYYSAVGEHMEDAWDAKGRAAVHNLVKLMKLKTDPGYISALLDADLSWQQIVYGAENNIEAEYLAAIMRTAEDAE